jgi:hypothetical protein
MKSFLACLFVGALCFSVIPACQTMKADLAAVETKLESVDWSKAVIYWQDYVKGLNVAIPVAEALFPGTKNTLETIVKPVVADADKSVQTLVGTVVAYKAGTLTEADAQDAAKDVQKAVVAASDIVGQALKGKVAMASQMMQWPWTGSDGFGVGCSVDGPGALS